MKESILCTFEISSAMELIQTLHFSLRQTLQTRAKSSQLLHQNITRIVSRSYINILLLWNLLILARTVHQSYSIPLSSILLLVWFIKWHCKCQTAFLIHSANVHIHSNKSMVRPITLISQSLVPISAIVSLLLWRDTMTTATLINKHLLGGLQFQRFSLLSSWWDMTACR